MLLATYGHGITNAPLDVMIATLERSGNEGPLNSVKPRLEYHGVDSTPAGVVTGIEQLVQADVCINDGFSVFRRAILEAMEPGEGLVEQPVRALDRARGASRSPVLRHLGADGHHQG